MARVIVDDRDSRIGRETALNQVTTTKWYDATGDADSQVSGPIAQMAMNIEAKKMTDIIYADSRMTEQAAGEFAIAGCRQGYQKSNTDDAETDQ